MTSESIDGQGRIALYRALNIGRAVVVVGSGASMARGLPSWSTLLSIYASAMFEAIFDAFSDPRYMSRVPFRKARTGLSLLLRGYQKRCSFPALVETELTLRALWEEFVGLTGFEEDRVEETGFRLGLGGDMARLTVVFDVCERLLERIERQRTNRGEELKSITQNYFARALLAHAAGKSRYSRFTHEVAVPSDYDPIPAIREALGVRRALTLNYDLEIEKTAFDALSLRGLSFAGEFERLIDWSADSIEIDAARPPRLVTARDGAHRALVSSRFKHGRTSDIVSFALNAQRDEFAVAHLHGRIDNPESLVLSRESYNNLYLRDAESRRNFDEALNVLFGGNAVLFIGVGMSEHEVMRPLEQFISDLYRSDHAVGQVFALMPTGRPRLSNKDFSRLIAEGQNVNNENINAWRTGLEKSWLQRDKSFSLDLFMRYRVNTLYYGDETFRRAISTVDWMRKAQISDIEKYCSGVKEKILKLWADALGVLCAPDSVVHGVLSSELDSVCSGQDRARKAAILRLNTLFRSHALTEELKRIKRKRGEWWKDWQQRPKPRNARFLPLSAPYFQGPEATAPMEGYLFLRHRADYRWSWSPAPFADDGLTWKSVLRGEAFVEESFDPIMHLRELGKCAAQECLRRSVDRGMKGQSSGMRVLRVAIPRGGGKGCIASLLQRREIHQSIFPRWPSPNGHGIDRPQIYAGAFMAHLAFTTEFSSVILSLSRFLALQISRISLQVPVGDEVYGALNRLQREIEAARHGTAEMSQDLKEEVEALADANCEPGMQELKREPSDQELRGAAEALYKKRRLRHPLLALHPELTSRDELPLEPVPPHRLDTLRALLENFASRAAAGDRIMICLTGIDRICDRDGDGLSPMHRAFFRMLTAPERGDGDGLEGDPPIDLILASGRPEVPICYLSHEIGKERLGEPHPADPSRRIMERDVALKSKTGRRLLKWPTLRPFRISERAFLTPIADPQRRLTIQLLSLWLRAEGPWAGDRGGPKHRYIRRMLATDAGLQMWVQTALTHKLEKELTQSVNDWIKAQRQKKEHQGNKHEHDGPDEVEDAQSFSELLSTAAIDAEAHRDHTSTVKFTESDDHVKSALSIWLRQLTGDNNQSGAFAKLQETLDDLDRAAATQRFNDVFAYVEAIYRDRTFTIDAGQSSFKGEQVTIERRSASEEWALDEIVLKHLALFTLPVEIWVLYGCPEVVQRLRRLVKEPPERPMLGVPDGGTRWKWRTANLRMLHRSLTRLCAAGLVVRVTGALGSDELNEELPEEAEAGKYRSYEYRVPASERAIHLRYAINDRLREYYARKMNLTLPDRGESNHYQVSVFCDQPRDLPTPSADHFRLVQGIVERHVQLCRETLWHTYRNASIEHSDRRSGVQAEQARDRQDKFAAKGGARRLFQPYICIGENGPVDGLDEIAGHFGRMHAIPQRLRASFSLVRGAFSLGAISRLEYHPNVSDEQPPFERYRGWIRGLLNAAVAVAEHDERYREVFSGAAAEAVERAASAGHSAAKRDWRMAIARVRDGRIAKGTSKLHKGLTQRQKSWLRPQRQEMRQPFYRDEIAWLYNERGLTSLVQGKLFDALPLFAQAKHFMTHRSSAPTFDSFAYHAAERRIDLNMSIAHIERGNIDRARRILTDLIVSTERREHSTPSMVESYAEGYLAYCEYLAGSLEHAITKFGHVIEEFERRRRLRPVSIFNRLLAQALYRIGEEEKANRAVKVAIDAAAHAEQRDVYYEALLTKALVIGRRREGEDIPAIRFVERAADYARRMGLERLLAEAMVQRAGFLIGEGETESAGRAAVEAAAIAMRNGLGLSRIAALTLYGEVMMSRKQFQSARRLLRDAKSEAERVGYQTMAARAQELQSKLPAKED